MRDNYPSSSETESSSAKVTMFNLDKLNEDRPKVLRGPAWSHGQIPESLDSLIESLVQRVDRSRFRFKVGNSRSTGPQLIHPQALNARVAHEGISNQIVGMGQLGSTSSPSQEAYRDPTISLDTGSG